MTAGQSDGQVVGAERREGSENGETAKELFISEGVERKKDKEKEKVLIKNWGKEMNGLKQVKEPRRKKRALIEIK